MIKIKIKFEGQEREFKTEREVYKFVSGMGLRQPFQFQQLEYSNGSLETMDYLTCHKGHVSETYNTRS